LIRQLVEYKKFKDAAYYLEKREADNQQIFASERQDAEEKNDEEPVLNVGIFDLIRAFQGILKRFEDEEDLAEIADDRFTVSDKIDYLMVRVNKGQKIKFTELFAEATTKGEVMVTFLALLELIRLNEFQVRQEAILGEIEIKRSSDEKLG
jgi:segregation and condensation protein A